MRCLRFFLLISALGAAQVQAGVFDDDEARRQLADQKIKTEARFDQQAKAQLDLANQLARKDEEIARLRGQVETLNYKLEVSDKRVQDFYLDLDSRMRKLETPPAVESNAATGASATSDTAVEAQEYEAALNLFKAGKYKEAAGGFADFAQKYPDSSLAPNAQYWLGNAWYAQHDCRRAIGAQSVVTTKYPESGKAADAWLAIATCQQELGNLAGGRHTLETVIAKYPNTSAAETAQQRLKKK
jgi:tol-pal system protein YbgF